MKRSSTINIFLQSALLSSHGRGIPVQLGRPHRTKLWISIWKETKQKTFVSNTHYFQAKDRTSITEPCAEAGHKLPIR